MRHSWDQIERMPSLTIIPHHVIILYGTEGIWYGKEALRDDVVKKNDRKVDLEVDIG